MLKELKFLGYSQDPFTGSYSKRLYSGVKIYIHEADGEYEVYLHYTCKSTPGTCEVKFSDLSVHDLYKGIDKIEAAIVDFHASLVKNKV